MIGVEVAAVNCKPGLVTQLWAHWFTAKLLEQLHAGVHAVAECESLSWP